MTTVLIVEDDARSRKLLADVLVAHGYEVVQTDRGEDALALALAHRPALALLDIHLPGIDGFATLRALRADAHFADLPAVAVTASVMSADRARVTESGFDALLHKPVRLQPLLDTLREVMRRTGDAAAGGG